MKNRTFASISFFVGSIVLTISSGLHYNTNVVSWR
jgi:hypothetical protein